MVSYCLINDVIPYKLLISILIFHCLNKNIKKLLNNKLK